MELASRIVSILLGAAVTIMLLWPVAIPLGFGEIWWTSRQDQTSSKAQGDAVPAPLETKPAAATNPAEAKPEALNKDRAEPRHQGAAGKESDKTGAIAPNPPLAPAPQAETKLYRHVAVRDGGTLAADGAVIKLAGIAAREASATCKDARGKTWRCGAEAKAALAKLIRARAVTCTLPKSGEHNIFVARCSVGGTDLSGWMVRQGWAEPKDTNEDSLAEAAAAAKKEGIGLWRTE
jgi:endonuclease YncB( thermonuclease family)